MLSSKSSTVFEPFSVSDSFENRLNSKITQLKLDLHQSKLFQIRDESGTF